MFCVAIFCSSAEAEVMSVPPASDLKNSDSPEANVYFLGEITPQKIVELGSTLDGINIRYGDIKGINLYISSSGGNMDAGRMGYWMVKSSRIPVRTINLSYVGSAATLLFCAGKDRDVMAGSQFLMHSASMWVDQGYLKPDELERTRRDLDANNQIFRDVYKECTSLADNEMEPLFKGDYFSRPFGGPEALKIGMATGTANAIRPVVGAGYVFSKQKD